MTIKQQLYWILGGAGGVALLWTVFGRRRPANLGQVDAYPDRGRKLFPGKDLSSRSRGNYAPMLTGRLGDERFKFVMPKPGKRSNVKVGAMPAVYISSETCPISCVNRKDKTGACYGCSGNVPMHWKETNISGIRLKGLLSKIGTIKPDAIWRYGIAGDAPGKGDRIDTRKLRKIIEASKAVKARGFMYTHKPVLGGPHAENNREVIAEANAYSDKFRHGMTVNLSANTLEHADRLYDLGIAPVVTIMPTEFPKDNGNCRDSAGNVKPGVCTPKGRRVVQCAAQALGKTCTTCGGGFGPWCARTRDFIVGLAAHGGARRLAGALATGAPQVVCERKLEGRRRYYGKQDRPDIVKDKRGNPTVPHRFLSRQLIDPGKRLPEKGDCFTYLYTPDGKFLRRPFQGSVAPTKAEVRELAKERPQLVQLRKFQPIKPDMALPVTPRETIPDQASVTTAPLTTKG